jgi:hypothetical protein
MFQHLLLHLSNQQPTKIYDHGHQQAIWLYSVIIDQKYEEAQTDKPHNKISKCNLLQFSTCLLFYCVLHSGKEMWIYTMCSLPYQPPNVYHSVPVPEFLGSHQLHTWKKSWEAIGTHFPRRLEQERSFKKIYLCRLCNRFCLSTTLN